VFVCGLFEMFSVVDGDENEMGEVRGDEGVVGDEVEGALGTENGDEIGGGGGRGNSKISTTFEI
jgi:hypothetical protein